jgi:hypothetical protein
MKLQAGRELNTNDGGIWLDIGPILGWAFVFESPGLSTYTLE